MKGIVHIDPPFGADVISNRDPCILRMRIDTRILPKVPPKTHAQREQELIEAFMGADGFSEFDIGGEG